LGILHYSAWRVATLITELSWRIDYCLLMSYDPTKYHTSATF